MQKGTIIELRRVVRQYTPDAQFIFDRGCRFMVERVERGGVIALDPWYKSFYFESKDFQELRVSPFVQFQFAKNATPQGNVTQ
jgi:hypothetical protein